MKQLNLVIFITVFVVIYSLGNYYVFLRGFQALSLSGWQKNLYFFVAIVLFLSFIIERFTARTSLFTLNHICTWIGSFWLATLWYLFLGVVLIDIVRLLNYGFHFLPDPGTMVYAKLKLYTFFSLVILVTIAVITGHLNALTIHVKNLSIETNKNIGDKKELTIAMVSDIHLGILVGKHRLEKMVGLINNSNPDIIVIAGDILDESQEAILKENIGEPLKKLNAPMGVYAITGNHEYIGGIKQALAYINTLNIQVLKDTVKELPGNLTLIGRDDYHANRFGGKKRQSLEELMTQVDTSNFLLLLDHQPYNLDSAVKSGIDLQLSGHTHNGQFWPFNHITKATFEVSWGYLQKGNTQFYVSSGFGTWGPSVRIASKSEIVIIKLRIKSKG